MKGKTGLTQRDLAAALDMDKATVSRILSGRGNPTARTIGEMCWALGLEPELILHERGYEKNHALQPVITAAPVPDRNLKFHINAAPGAVTQPVNAPTTRVAWATAS